MKQFEWKFERKLNKKTIDLIEKQVACEEACRAIVEQVVKHWEENKIASTVMWKTLEKQFGLDLKNNDYRYQDGEIEARPKFANKMEKLFNDVELNKAVEKVFIEAIKDNK